MPNRTRAHAASSSHGRRRWTRWWLALIAFFVVIAIGAGVDILARRSYPAYTGGIPASALRPRPRNQPSQQVIVAQWPTHINWLDSDSIAVSLIPVSQLPRIVPANAPEDPVADRMAIVATPVPIGSANVPLDKAFGAHSPVSLTATLAAPGFTEEAAVPGDALQSQSEMAWSWSITPKNVGWQAANVSIYAFGSPKGNSGSSSHLIWTGTLYIHAVTGLGSVLFSLLQVGVAPLIGAIGGIAGAALTLIFSNRSSKTAP